MFVLDKIKSTTVAGLFMALCVSGITQPASANKAGLGKPAAVEEIRGWDIDIRPDGKGLPAGQGDAIAGEDVFIEKCSACHGEFAEGAGRYPALSGGQDSLTTHEPIKTVGSFWPYASTVFDYVRRAMPFGHAQSLTNDEVYAMTAYILYSNDIIEDDFVLNKETLPKVEMPNRDGFIADTRKDEPKGKPCMKNCLAKPAAIIGRARHIDVTPESEAETAGAESGADTASASSRGKEVFAAQCMACHSINKDEHKVGPSLHGLIGRNVGTTAGFARFSNAMQAGKFAWTEGNLREFLAAPQTFLPGNSMPFGGVQDSAMLDDLLAFLQETAVAK